MTLHGRDRLEAHADAGLGADELGLRRFTRAVERAEARALTDHKADRIDPRVAQHLGKEETPASAATENEGNPNSRPASLSERK